MPNWTIASRSLVRLVCRNSRFNLPIATRSEQNPGGMETDPDLVTHTESRAETGDRRTKTRETPIKPVSPTQCPAAHTPTRLTSTPPTTTSSCPLKHSSSSSNTHSLSPSFTPCSSSTPTANNPNLTPTPLSLNCKTLPYVSPALNSHAPAFTTTPPSISANPVAVTTPTPPPLTLIHSLPIPSHAPPPYSHVHPPSSPTTKMAPPHTTPPTLSPTPRPLASIVSAATSPPTCSVTNSNVNSQSIMTNGNARTAPTSPPITPFHTTASRQVPSTLAIPSLLPANHSLLPVRQRVSQQALLLSRSPCSSRDQMLLRAQMLQSLTLRPSDPGRLTIPPSLRLKPPNSCPRTPIFPPLRPRPQSSSMETDRRTTSTRDLSVPPTLYSSVRSVPLRPRLHSPNDHKVAPPRPSPTLQLISAADHLVLPSRPWPGPGSSQSSQTLPKQAPVGQSQLGSCSRPLPLGSTSCFDRLPPASRQLQIIALSAGSSRLSSQPRPAVNTHTPASVQSQRLVFESPPTHLDAQQQRTSDYAPPTLLHIANSPLPSFHDSQAELGSEEERKGEGVDEEEVQSEMTGMEDEGEQGIKMAEEQRKRMEVEEEQGEKEAVKVDEERTSVHLASPVDPQPSIRLATKTHGSPDVLQNSSTQVDTPPASEPPVDLQTPSGRHYLDQQDLSENMSTQSDNQSVLSSLSSQSAPPSPFVIPPSDVPPPLLPVSPSQTESLSVPHSCPERLDISQREPWKPRAWPEDERRILTHLVEGFVIHEGLQAFPMTRSSLLPGEHMDVSQNLNADGAAILPFTDAPELPEHSSESEQERTSTDDPLTAPRVRQRGMLQCESCGKRGHAHSFHRSKRYCSTSCSHRYNLGLSKRLRALSAGSRPEGRSSEINKAESVPGKPLLLRLPREIWSAHRHGYDKDGGRAVPMTTRLQRRSAQRARRASEPALTPADPPATPANPRLAQWSVEQVWGFIHKLPGCRDVAEAFRVQEIDGQALLLLTEDHLMTSMNIKLGPALKICAHINAHRHR
ncbi:hypothetical protein DPEC_G00078870 [Dallia pectoralis]|uniref:Uncharacterized protein n=1 Tax=Dallia pectoralis TaxID=75939 RepID=A0ACC2H4Y2_DALPE|nr:hypothetical protein DPEC_G00078870 [Dallia pectoralis]